MALNTPTVKDISDNIISQLELSLNQTIPLMPKSFARVLAKVLGGVFILLYKYAGFSLLQQFVRHATIEPTTINGKTVRPLIEWGRTIGVGDPTPATNAELTIEITVESQTGTLQSNTQLINTNTGVTYVTLATINLDAATKTVNVRAVGDQSGGDGSGAIGNMDVSDTMTFANPLANVARDATVTAQVTTGANAEETEVYRQRVLDRFQKRPQGGAYSDYEQWGESEAGIVNVYPYTSPDCGGQIDVYVEATEASSGSADGIPTAAQLQAVKDAIELDDDGLASRRPANAFVNTFAITRTGFDVTINGLDVNDTAQVEADIEASLITYFLQREPYILGLTVGSRKDRITVTSVSGVVEDIVSAAGGVFTSLFLEQSGSPVTAVYALGSGEKAKLNSVTFN